MEEIGDQGRGESDVDPDDPFSREALGRAVCRAHTHQLSHAVRKKGRPPK